MYSKDCSKGPVEELDRLLEKSAEIHPLERAWTGRLVKSLATVVKAKAPVVVPIMHDQGYRLTNADGPASFAACSRRVLAR